LQKLANAKSFLRFYTTFAVLMTINVTAHTSDQSNCAEDLTSHDARRDMSTIAQSKQKRIKVKPSLTSRAACSKATNLQGLKRKILPALCGNLGTTRREKDWSEGDNKERKDTDRAKITEL
jgi:hypothetical protein